MKVKCDRRELLEALTLAGTVVPLKSTQPVLQNVKMVAAGNTLEILATDWEVALRYSVEKVEVLEEGEVLLPTRQLTEVLRELPDEAVEFSVEDNILTMSKGNDFFKVQGDDPTQFPEIPAFEEDGIIEVDPSTFIEMIKKTAFAAAKEKMRYALNGVFLKIEGSNISMVATDGKRLARIKRRIKGKKGLEAKAIVPTKGIMLIEKILGQEEAPVRLRITDKQCMAATRRAVISSRLVEGQFPSYEDVIPKSMDKKLRLVVAPFLALIRQAAAFTSPESMAVKIKLGDDKLEISAHAADVGEAKVEMSVEYSGEPIEMGFNPVFIKDVLNVIGSEEITLELKESTNPCIISDGEDYLYVVMPVNVI
jgi:DNA polymerase-3 subunit beta